MSTASRMMGAGTPPPSEIDTPPLPRSSTLPGNGTNRTIAMTAQMALSLLDPALSGDLSSPESSGAATPSSLGEPENPTYIPQSPQLFSESRRQENTVAESTEGLTSAGLVSCLSAGSSLGAGARNPSGSPPVPGLMWRVPEPADDGETPPIRGQAFEPSGYTRQNPQPEGLGFVEPEFRGANPSMSPYEARTHLNPSDSDGHTHHGSMSALGHGLGRMPMPMPSSYPTPVPMPMPSSYPTPVPMPMPLSYPTPMPLPMPMPMPMPMPSSYPTAAGYNQAIDLDSGPPLLPAGSGMDGGVPDTGRILGMTVQERRHLTRGLSGGMEQYSLPRESEPRVPPFANVSTDTIHAPGSAAPGSVSQSSSSALQGPSRARTAAELGHRHPHSDHRLRLRQPPVPGPPLRHHGQALTSPVPQHGRRRNLRPRRPRLDYHFDGRDVVRRWIYDESCKVCIDCGHCTTHCLGKGRVSQACPNARVAPRSQGQGSTSYTM
ncbi:hypothetical protein GQ53DRAFT_401883 [Thozetella sp. PMI_491]|nr:hypothetical protein GQ53DRAFT_401883 [Thozetella sp. PMI_491]